MCFTENIITDWLMKKPLISQNMKNQQSINNSINCAINGMLLHYSIFVISYAFACVRIHFKSSVLSFIEEAVLITYKTCLIWLWQNLYPIHWNSLTGGQTLTCTQTNVCTVLYLLVIWGVNKVHTVTLSIRNPHKEIYCLHYFVVKAKCPC